MAVNFGPINSNVWVLNSRINIKNHILAAFSCFFNNYLIIFFSKTANTRYSVVYTHTNTKRSL